LLKKFERDERGTTGGLKIVLTISRPDPALRSL